MCLLTEEQYYILAKGIKSEHVQVLDPSININTEDKRRCKAAP